jgi:NADPH:quinone reductase-like Zn-dependent oxidoreductase
VKLDTTLTLKKDDKVPGSGILTSHFSDGATFPLKDAAQAHRALESRATIGKVVLLP